jgi:hypothetical protein
MQSGRVHLANVEPAVEVTITLVAVPMILDVVPREFVIGFETVEAV